MYVDYGKHRSGGRTVFDRAKASGTGGTVTGLASRPISLGVARRDSKDRRVGTPVTAQLLGDPDPDRLAKAEALRQMHLANDARRRRFVVPPAEELAQEPRARVETRGGKSRQEDVPEPRGTYFPIDREKALYEAVRGDQVLLFASYKDFGRCLLGRQPTDKELGNMRNNAGGVTKTCFGGWKINRLLGDNTRSVAARRRQR